MGEGPPAIDASILPAHASSQAADPAEGLPVMFSIRLCENMRALGYAPFYLALAEGHFSDAGLEIALITSPSPSRTGTMLLEGAADVSWGGPMRVMTHHEDDPDCSLVCFAQIVARDPFVLVGREPNPRFRFQDLLSCRVGVATEVPTPWMMLQDDLARAGMDPASLNRAPNLPIGGQRRPATGGRGGRGAGVRTLRGRTRRGGLPCVAPLLPTAATSLTLRSTRRGALPTTTGRRAAVWCVAWPRRNAASMPQAPTTLPGVIGPFFPDFDPRALARIVAGYRATGVWSRTPALSAAAFVRLKAALLSRRSDQPRLPV